MYLTRLGLLLCGLAGLAVACANGAQTKPTERKFYKNPYVRRCLQYDKEQLDDEARACWARLLKRVQGEPGFKEKAEFTDSDLSKMRKMSSQAIERSEKLQKEREACLNIPSAKRDDRIQCFQVFLKTYEARLTRSQRFEIESAIAELRTAKKVATGDVEATIEHAGKLLGARFLEEKEGIRIDSLHSGGPLRQATAPEQGIVLTIDDVHLGELGAAERIAKLESCEDGPVKLLIRHGGIGDITFTRVEASCGKRPLGTREWQVVLPQETCTTGKSPEVHLGISWCYIAKQGILEVEEVCADSPAAQAGVRPGHRYVTINGASLLGKTYVHITEMLKKYPEAPLAFREKAGALQSPTPLKEGPLDEARSAKCWRAIQTVLEQGDMPDGT